MKKPTYQQIEIIEISKQILKHKTYIILLLRTIKRNASFYVVNVRNGAKGRDVLFDSGELTDINEAYNVYEKAKDDLTKIINEV